MILILITVIIILQLSGIQFSCQMKFQGICVPHTTNKLFSATWGARLLIAPENKA